VYFASANSDGILGFQDYLQLEGSAFRLVPIKTKKSGRFSHGRIESSLLYDNLMHKFRWGRMNQPHVLIDDYNINTYAVLHTRITFARLAEQLYMEGKKDSAFQVLNHILELMPAKTFPHDVYSLDLTEVAYKIGAIKQAHQIISEYSQQSFEEISFFYAMPIWQFNLTKTENIIDQQTIEQLTDMADKYGDSPIREELEKKLKEITKD